MTTMTDDLSEIRADIRAINERLDRYQAETNERLDRHQAQTNERLDKFQTEVTTRLDKFQSDITRLQNETNARIDRVLWAVISIGSVIGIGFIAAIFTAIFRFS